MQEQKYSIKELPKDDRPREKLRDKGTAALSEAELLSILIGQGTRNQSALDLARSLLLKAGNHLSELGKFSMHDFCRIHGIGPVKALTLMAAFELGRRRHTSSFKERALIKDSRDVAEYFKTLYQDLDFEVFAVLYLNQANKVKFAEIISEGGLTGTIADPRIILKRALEEKAVSLVLCHNHPSGNLKPSRADQELTLKIKEASKYFDIKVLDHIIVSNEGYYSFADEGIL